jgi:CMP-N-acetylneuraminate monooxygenase
MIETISKISAYKKKLKKTSIEINTLNEGVNSTNEFFIKKEKNQIKWVVNRICDHNFGKLIIKKNETSTATCPIHQWKLNLKNLKYENKVPKKKISFKENGKFLEIFDLEQSLKFNNLRTNYSKNKFTQIRYLSHASVLISDGKTKILTDPWFIGPAFCNGWWLREEPKFDFEKLIKDIDYIFISHNHPDHLHIETLNKINKNIPIITPKFLTNSTKILLKRLGFKKIYDLNFNYIFKIKDSDINFTILKSGDFRDDSGIYFEIRKKKILLNVDCNNLNGGILPQDIDVLLSSFAGGASGFPLCFDDFSLIEKERILDRNRKAIFNMVVQLIKKTKCKIFIPYAGFFSEKAARDKYVFENNKKNTLKNFENYSKQLNSEVKILDTAKFDTVFLGSKIRFKKQNNIKRSTETDIKSIENYIKISKKNYSNLSSEYIQEYFKNSNFKSNLVLYLIPTNDDFELNDEGYIINFSKKDIEFRILQSSKISKIFQKIKSGNDRHLFIKAREDSLNMVFANKLPWEDLLIGFQCRIQRKPNIYNNDFWQHFTNKYIDKVNFRYKNPCDSCEVLFQQVY